MELEDGATRIFLNTRGTNPEGVSEELIELLEYFEHSTAEMASRAGSERIARLHEKISDIKASEEIGVKFMNAWEEKLLNRQDGYEEGLKEGEKKGLKAGRKEGKKEGLKEGLAAGEKKGHREIAARMKAKGMDLTEIAELTGLEISQLEKL